MLHNVALESILQRNLINYSQFKKKKKITCVTPLHSTHAAYITHLKDVHSKTCSFAGKVHLSLLPPEIQSTSSVFVLSLTPLAAELPQTLADSAAFLCALTYERNDSRAKKGLIFFS